MSNDALEAYLREGGKITQIEYGVARDINICMNCKGTYPTHDLKIQGSVRRCRKCRQRRSELISKRKT